MLDVLSKVPETTIDTVLTETLKQDKQLDILDIIE